MDGEALPVDGVEEVDVAGSTCAETLRRAGETTVEEVVDETDPTDERAPAVRT